MPYKLVDLFAGPGGLSEGFARTRNRDGGVCFERVISVEADETAHQTLTLRAFRRRAEEEGDRKAMRLYWNYLANQDQAAKSAMMNTSAWRAALHENGGRPLTLGLSGDDSNVEERLRARKLSEHAAWVLIGGPPCQAYSLVGRARMRGRDPVAFSQDHRHVLYREYLRIIRLFRPAVFVMENVKGLLSSRLEGQLIFSRMLDDLRRGGIDRSSDDLYEIRSLTAPNDHIEPSQFVVRSEFYGVPQARHRVFLLGIQRDVIRSLRGAAPWSRFLLEPTTPTSDEFLTTLHAVADLPPLVAKSSHTGLSYREDSVIRTAFARAIRAARGDVHSRTRSNNWAAAKVMTAALRKPRGAFELPTNSSAALARLYNVYDTKRAMHELGRIPNHDSRAHMPDDLARYLYIASWAQANGRSPTLSDYPRSILPKHANVRAGVQDSVFADRFRVQIATRPSTTVTSHISKDGHYFVHYDPAQHRSLSVREAARLQTFPDDYFFEGPRTAQYHQVGNAVPPLLAQQIADVVVRLLTAAFP